jgi:hypothetical protein
MNKDLETAGKFKRISLIIFGIYFISTIILVPLFSYLFDNYWLLFGIIFSYLGTIVKNNQIGKGFFLIIIVIIIYWIENGFDFSDQVTFYWFSFLFGSICQSFRKVYDELAQHIIDREVGDINSYIKGRVEMKRKQDNKQL